MGKTPVKYVHLSEKSLKIVEDLPGKRFSEKLEELIWGYEAEKRAKEFELNFLDKKIAKRKQELRELSEAVEKVRSILNKYTYRNGGY